MHQICLVQIIVNLPIFENFLSKLPKKQIQSQATMPLLPSILKNRPASAEPPAAVNTENCGAKNASAQQQTSKNSTKNSIDEQKQQNEPFDAVKKISEEFDRKRAEFFADFSTK